MTTKSSSRRIRAGSQELPSRITVLVFTTLSRIFIFTPLLLCSVRKANRECTVPCSGGPGACLMVRESQCTASELYSDCTVQWLQLHRQQEPPESVCHELHLVGSDADTCWATRITWSSRPASPTDADTISTSDGDCDRVTIYKGTFHSQVFICYEIHCVANVDD